MMKKNKDIWCIIVILGCIVAGCRKPYNPPAILAPNSYLVVEGVINSGADSTVITLSKTVNLSETPSSTLLSNATVTVEADGGAIYPLQASMSNPGKYIAVGLNLDNTKKYRLHITASGNKYLSDYVAVKATPPIDSITYKITEKGLQINSNTHDVTNNTRYYRWAYEETWRFHARFNSGLIVKNGEVVFRGNDEQIYYCYAGDKSSNIVLASSSKLLQDVISQNPVTLIQSNSEKLGIRYSILLKQYALTKEGYAFWENIKKNSEQLGSIFDPQPSEIKGNIHNVTNPAEPVVGYLSVTNVQTKRIFISNNDLPLTWQPQVDAFCQIDSVLFANPHNGANDVQNQIVNGGLIPISTISKDGFHVIGYTASTVECTDCRVRGQVTAPPFWK
ncbi:DUF4249 domain-containing protein [Mucilaginibacter sp. KACC 22773]|uniref:DUF4249 domain-containing protein n=1 Tax=Mucilaginibacter sp. KACC 22773 TaxID=3025671 RepID=UPI0023658899|nr:DUF4249 domain-containing protein [Mucilaginibacter sp. KACC 22773]WDF78055.1 DUF4249 domain-containing protein [Mucilaginibacter sp. KACC 22773]